MLPELIEERRDLRNHGASNLEVQFFPTRRTVGLLDF